MEILIAIILIAMTIIYFLMRRDNKVEESEQDNDQKSSKISKSQVRKELIKSTPADQTLSSVPLSDNKECLINSFRELKDMKNLRFIDDGNTLLFSDEKRIIVGFFTNFADKSFKFISKTLDGDTIADLVYSKSKKIIAVALKQNSRDIIFYQMSEDENKKLKLNKLDKMIRSNRKFGIKNLSISKCGNYVASSGTDQDTVVQIFDVEKCTMLESIDTNEINNIDIKFSPCDNYLTVSTFMYEIACMEFKRTARFNKAINGDEITLKILRTKSIGGIKVPIVSYEFSNDNKYFVVSCESGNMKIMQNLGAVEDSKIIYDINVDKSIMKYAEKVSLYVQSSFNNKLKGFLAASNNRNILIFNLEGKVERRFIDCHENEIIGIKIAKNFDDQLILLSGSRDGKFHVWKI